MPKIVDHDKRKEDITQKAMSVFIEKGYYNTNLIDIAKNVELVAQLYTDILRIKMIYSNMILLK